MYAIKSIKTGKWLFGTNFRFSPPHQRTSSDQCMTWEDKNTAESEFRRRHCNSDYKIVRVKIEEVDNEEDNL